MQNSVRCNARMRVYVFNRLLMLVEGIQAVADLWIWNIHRILLCASE